MQLQIPYFFKKSTTLSFLVVNENNTFPDNEPLMTIGHTQFESQYQFFSKDQSYTDTYLQKFMENTAPVNIETNKLRSLTTRFVWLPATSKNKFNCLEFFPKLAGSHPGDADINFGKYLGNHCLISTVRIVIPCRK